MGGRFRANPAIGCRPIRALVDTVAGLGHVVVDCAAICRKLIGPTCKGALHIPKIGIQALK